MNRLSVNPSRRTHFSLSYYIYSKLHMPYMRYTRFFNGEKTGVPHARRHRIEDVRFQICPASYPTKPTEPFFLGNRRRGPSSGCATVVPGAQNTTDTAGNLPDSEVFSRPEFKVLGVGIAYPQGRQHGCIHVLNPHIQSLRLKSAVIGFQSHTGAETMTNVIRTTTPKAAPLGNTPATIPSIIGRQQAIENALTTALYFIRLPHTDSGLKAATGRAIRAASMLKQACAEAQIGGAA
jgi:hypothetical protein